MARPRVHSDDFILDATRDLICSGGVGAASTAAICAASGAPSGSLYHRFGSRNLLLARVWIRTVRRFQLGLVDAVASGSQTERIIAAALWTIDFAASHPQDAALLMLYRREDLLGDNGMAELHEELLELNRPVSRLVRELCRESFGNTSKVDLELTAVAMIDIPYGVVRRSLSTGTSLAVQRTVVEAASRAVLSTRQP